MRIIILHFLWVRADGGYGLDNCHFMEDLKASPLCDHSAGRLKNKELHVSLLNTEVTILCNQVMSLPIGVTR